MLGTRRKLKDKSGNDIFPVTTASAVYMPDGITTVDVEFNGITINKVNWINVAENGIKKDGTEQTEELNSLLYNNLKSGEKTVFYFPSGIYNANILIDTIKLAEMVQGRYIYLNCMFIGDGDKSILTASNGSIVKMVGTEDNQYNRITIRNFSFQNIKIDGSNNPVTGLELISIQSANFSNFTIANCGHDGLREQDVWDCNWSNINILGCANLSNGSYVTNWASIKLKALYDNCNNQKFSNLRIEGTPIFIWNDGANRHNFFSNCKFEKGADNTTLDVRPFHLVDPLELYFENCSFINSTANMGTENGIIENGKKYFHISFSNPSYSGVPYTQNIHFTNCDFTTPPACSTQWGSFLNTYFVNCSFKQCEGNGLIFPFVLLGNVKMIATNIVVKSGKKIFDVVGSNCDINVTVNLLDNTNNTASFNLQNTSNNNRISYELTGNDVNLASLFSSLGTDFANAKYKNNKFINKNRIYRQTAGSDFGLEGVNTALADGTSMSTIYHMYEGQTVVVIANNASGLTITHTPGILQLKGGANKTLAKGENITFKLINNIIYEV